MKQLYFAQPAASSIATISVADLAGARLKKAPSNETTQRKASPAQSAGTDQLMAEIKGGAFKLRSVSKEGEQTVGNIS